MIRALVVTVLILAFLALAVYFIVSTGGSRSTSAFIDLYNQDYFKDTVVTFADGIKVPVLIRLVQPIDYDSTREANLQKEIQTILTLSSFYRLSDIISDSKIRYEFENRIENTLSESNLGHKGRLEILNVHFCIQFAKYFVK